MRIPGNSLVCAKHREYVRAPTELVLMKIIFSSMPTAPRSTATHAQRSVRPDRVTRSFSSCLPDQESVPGSGVDVVDQVVSRRPPRTILNRGAPGRMLDSDEWQLVAAPVASGPNRIRILPLSCCSLLVVPCATPRVAVPVCICIRHRTHNCQSSKKHSNHVYCSSCS